MHKFTAMIAIGMTSLLPLSALAADAPADKTDAKPAMEMHGFDKYWSMMDPAGKGFVTKDEWLAHAADRFKEIDTNGDGKISKEEMKAHDDKMHAHFKEMRAKHMSMMKDHPGGMMNGQGQDMMKDKSGN